MKQTPRANPAFSYSPPGHGAPVPIRRFRTLVKVPAADTGRRYSLLEHALDPETLAMPMHRHRDETKTFYVIEGALTVQIEREVFVVTSGGSLVVPAGTMHTMWNESDRHVRFLSVVAPGGLEEYYAEVASYIPTGGKPDMDRVLEASARFGIELDMLSLLDIMERHQVQLA